MSFTVTMAGGLDAGIAGMGMAGAGAAAGGGISMGGLGALLGAGGAAGGLLGGLFGGKKGTAPSIMEDTSYNQMMQNGQGGNFNMTSGNNATYLADMYSQLGTGRNPSYWQSYVNQAQPYMQNQLTQQYFGTPGNRGVSLSGNPTMMGQSQNMAAMYGLNPQQGIDQMSRVNQQYQNSEDQINQYFMGQGINLMNQTAQNLPKYNTDYMNSLTEAFKPVFSSQISGVAGSNPMSGFASSLGSLGGGMMSSPNSAMPMFS